MSQPPQHRRPGGAGPGDTAGPKGERSPWWERASVLATVLATVIAAATFWLTYVGRSDGPRDGTASTSGSQAPAGSASTGAVPPSSPDARPATPTSSPGNRSSAPPTDEGSARRTAAPDGPRSTTAPILVDAQVTLSPGQAADLDLPRPTVSSPSGPGADLYLDPAWRLRAGTGDVVLDTGTPAGAEQRCRELLHRGASAALGYPPVPYSQGCFRTTHGRVGWYQVTGAQYAGPTTLRIRVWVPPA